MRCVTEVSGVTYETAEAWTAASKPCFSNLGRKRPNEPPPEATNVIDLMEALKKSLGKKAPAKSAPRKSAAASRKVHKKRSR